MMLSPHLGPAAAGRTELKSRLLLHRKDYGRRRSLRAKLLLKLSIETLDQLLDDFESMSRSNVCWSRSVVQYATFNKVTRTQKLNPDLSLRPIKRVPR